LEYETASLTGTDEWSAHFTDLANILAVDVYFNAVNGSGDTDIDGDSTVTDQQRGPCMDCEIIVLTSIGMDTWADQANGATFGEDEDETFWGTTLEIAAADTIEIGTVTSPSAFVVSNDVDGSLEYTGGETRESIYLCAQDATTGALFADVSFPGQYTGCGDSIVANNTPPSCVPLGNVVLTVDQAMTEIDLSLTCPDDDGDELTCTDLSAALPTGVSAGGTGNCTLSPSENAARGRRPSRCTCGTR
jgi:hypothetical protein